jgi:hypothetical protein
VVKNLRDEVAVCKQKKYEDEYDYQRAFDQLFSKISYAQIPEMIGLIEDMDTAMYRRDRIIDFLCGDFGLPLETKSFSLEEFKQAYNTHSEEGLYRYYLDKAGVPYKLGADSLDYQAIYKAFKFNINVSFVGGGGGYNEYAVYPLIKLLELKFGTTHGFPKKFCNWQGTYGCNSIDRVKRWIKFLKDNKLIPLSDPEAPTWSYQ